MKLLVALLIASCVQAAGYRAGVAAVEITPKLPFWLSGFAARTRPAENVTLPIYAKALALEDGEGGRVVIVTADLVGVTAEITSEVARRLEQSHKIRRDQLVFNASHTHSGPAVWPRLHIAPVTDPQVDRQVEAYGRRLMDEFTKVARQALDQMFPATLSFGQTEAGFATNRRVDHLALVRPGRSYPAPVDTAVPVWKVTAADGGVRALIFGYACHNTVLTAGFTAINGDYAGYAQQSLERAYPGAMALFLSLCAGDQRPAPRGKAELAVQHGETIAAAVRKRASSRMAPVKGRFRSAYEEIRLPFQAHTREVYEAEAKSSDFYAARRGKAMLAAFDAKRPIVDTAYPVTAIAFGDSAALVALGGEVVVDYALRLKKEFGPDRLVVAAYSNDVMGYIPTRRILREGGYEAGDSMVYFVQPGWFTDEVEELVLDSARRLLRRIGVRAAQ